MSDPTLFGAPSGGIVGHRQLIAVQTVDLGRLTHHPVPLVPSSLVAVSGTGPGRDSNGSGKTTFLASVSLLLGDPEWRIATTGGQDALGLLFDPDLSGDAAGLYDPARVGYVAGVFAHVTVDGNYDELTVWVRISSDDAPRLAARWERGVKLVSDPADAAAMWNALGRDRQVGPQSFVEQLYGGSGRCLAYVTSRGSRDTDTSLMQLQARLSPSRIGSELIVLLGLEHLIDGERDLRAKLAEAQQKLATRIDEHERREREWAGTLADIEARDSARAAIAEGRRLWRLRIARRLLDALEAEQRITRDLADLDAEFGQARSEERDVSARLEQLPDPSRLEGDVRDAQAALATDDEGWSAATRAEGQLVSALERLVQQIRDATTKALGAPPGLTLDEAEQHRARAVVDVDEATRAIGAAQADVRRAQTALEAVSQHGDADPGVQRALADAGVGALPLLDGIVLDAGARARWEPLLAPWRGALVVAAEQRDDALGVAPPGTVLVLARTGESEPLPDGVLEAPAGTAPFLQALAGRAQPPYTDVDAGVVVASGFEHELCGRDAATARARAVLADAQHALALVSARLDEARRRHALAVDAEDRVRAAQELDGLRAQESERSQQLGDARRTLAEAEAARRAAQERLVAVRVRRDTHLQERQSLDAELATTTARITGIERQLDGTRADLSRLDVEGWRAAWADTDDAAAAALDGDDRKEESLRRRANEHLGIALERVGVDSISGAGSPTPAITGVVRARGGLDEEVSPNYAVRRFDTVVQPLANWLDDQLDHDATFREDLERERARWDELITAARQEGETQANLVERHRDMVEQQIDASLEQVSARYAELDAAAGGYGAKLAWRSIRPTAPTDLWTWEVTPEWRRGHGARWLPYTRQANSAMQKQHRTHLVLAALLAAENPAGRVLIIDEAGNDFGREHLRQVLRAFAQVADNHGVSVIAACQDKVLEEVATLGAAKLLLWFERLSDASPLCRPTRVWGFDDDGHRVELTRTAVEAGRLL